MGGLMSDEGLEEIISTLAKGCFERDIAEELIAIRSAIRSGETDLVRFVPSEKMISDEGVKHRLLRRLQEHPQRNLSPQEFQDFLRAGCEAQGVTGIEFPPIDPSHPMPKIAKIRTNQSGLVIFVLVAAAAISSGVGLAVFESYAWIRGEMREKPKEVVIELSEDEVKGLPVVSECELRK